MIPEKKFCLGVTAKKGDDTRKKVLSRTLIGKISCLFVL